MNTCIQSVIGLAACAGLAVGTASAEDRSYDGTGNNLLDLDMGAAHTALSRLAECSYSDGFSAMVADRPNPRAISNAVFAQSSPSYSSQGLTDLFWQWGQFLDHDIDLTPGGTGEFANIAVPAGDAWLDPFNTGTAVIPFERSSFDPATGSTNVREQMNEITSYIDASNVYGSSAARANALRSGTGGRMLLDSNGFLPKNTMGLDNDNGPTGGPAESFFAAGDVRANEQVGLTSMHTLFVREHNAWADRLSDANPTWDDEQVYQAARRIVGAEMQNITYNEWLPALLGDDAVSDYTGYDDTVDASIRNEFSTALFRIGHTMLSDELQGVNGQSNLLLADAFFRPDVVEDRGVGSILQGLGSGVMQEIDAQIVDSVRNMLFGPPGAGGLDLASLNIQRGRDHGLPEYNLLREAFGLDAATSFDDVTSDPAVAQALRDVYGTDGLGQDNIHLLDLWVGALAEDHMPGVGVGELLYAGLVDQFEALRDGDRFFYLNDDSLVDVLATMGLTIDDLEARRLSHILTDNSSITAMQYHAFVIPAPGAAALLGLGVLSASRRRR